VGGADEGAKFWLQVLTELQNRGVQDIPDRGAWMGERIPEAIEAVYPHTEVQLCIVHLVRASLNYVPWKLRKPVVADLQSNLSRGDGGRSRAASGGTGSEVESYPSVSQVWRRTGRGLRRFSITRRISAAPSTPPTAWNH